MAPRDYKRRPRQKPKEPERRRSPWLYFITGMAAGAAVTVFVYFNEFIPVPLYVSPQSQPAERTRVNKKAEEKANNPGQPKPRFEFYTLLPEMEVAIPDAELKSESRSSSGSVSAPGTYYLQAGSFRLAEEADKMRANLAFLGLESSIQTVTINGTDTWHRVRIGPFSDLASLNDARRRLKENKIESIVLKIRG